jgi:hypothetical protein
MEPRLRDVVGPAVLALVLVVMVVAVVAAGIPS